LNPGTGDASVYGMPAPKRLQEAESRAGMKQVNAWVPVKMHEALARARAEDRVSLNEAIRQAVAAWLARREAARKRSHRKGGTR
jgi:hypothetical protein